MRLTINNLRKDDFGYYHCVARNELNATMVNFEIARKFDKQTGGRTEGQIHTFVNDD